MHGEHRTKTYLIGALKSWARLRQGQPLGMLSAATLEIRYHDEGSNYCVLAIRDKGELDGAERYFELRVVQRKGWGRP